MSKKRKTVLRNKARGRAYQTKVAEMFGGMNIGTLGGEDVMHDIYSIEAKTRKSFLGHELLNYTAESMPSNKNYSPVVNIKQKIPPYTNLILMRYSDFCVFGEHMFIINTIFKNKFIGFTFMNQSVSNCPEGKIPMVCVHVVGLRHSNDIVILNEADWEQLRIDAS